MEIIEKASHAKSILCVDDDTDTCELLQFVFSDYDFVSAHTIEEALRLIESRRFDLFIFDNWLPDGSGLALCQKVRALEIKAPIIFVSGVGETRHIREALDSGADKYLLKPCEPDLLKKVVKELII